MWGAHEVDGRIAAKNAVKIRAALKQSVDAKQIYEQYGRTQPNVSDNVTQDRARARAWALMNVLFNNEALRAALLRLYAEAWVTGDAAAGEAIGEERALRKAVEGAIDWSKWQPGDAAAAMLLDPPRAFEELITSSGSLIRGLDKTGYELIGTALADSIRAGYSPNRAAKLIQDAVGSPARALTIAVTESSRVMNASALNRYREAGIEKAQWMVVFGGGACEKCAQNAGKIVPLGGTYPSGNTQPPAHPHCRCNLRPVVPDYNEMFDESGNLMPLRPNNQGVSDIVAAKPVTPNFQIERGFSLTEQQIETIQHYQNTGFRPINNALRMPSATPQKYNAKYNTKYTPRNWEREVTLPTKELKNIIDSAPELQQPIQVFRGMKQDAASKLSRLGVGSVYKEPGFVSTSFSKDIADSFLGESGIMLEITVPQGTKGLSVQPFSKEFFNKTEELEWLMAPGTKFKVVGKSRKLIQIEVIP
jgi:SPP1 gp7 family putative phage head morphogenesis protein